MFTLPRLVKVRAASAAKRRVVGDILMGQAGNDAQGTGFAPSPAKCLP
jgi:hypothetical protein